MATLNATEVIQAGPRDWFISDHHFSHAGIINHAKRPFKNTDEMDRVMVQRWNERVGPEDRVIHLGDLYWGSDPQRWLQVRYQLNGRIALVPGNHDRVQELLDYGAVDEVLHPVCEVFYTCKRTKSKRYFTLCHYPLSEWPRLWSGSIHLHGHCHGNHPAGHPTPQGLRRLDISADVVDFLPQSPQELIDRFPVLA